MRALDPTDRAWATASLQRVWGSTVMVRKGAVVDAATLDGFVLVDGEERIGLLTHAQEGDELEVATLHVERPGVGGGRALLDAALDLAEQRGVRRMWLITTNDNTSALRFYQRWGMDLVAFGRDAVTESRRIKPSIPLVGDDGIPIRHELELELLLS